jgi:chemotaxis protein methyltransferase CheR
MLLDGMNPAVGNGVRYRIFTTDISLPALAAAREGTYDQEAVQNVKLILLQRYFDLKCGIYGIAPRLREHISFSVFDLLDPFSKFPTESIYGEFDIVFCSNVWFYFTADVQKVILAKIYQSMSDSGYLVTGEAEKASVEKTGRFRMAAPPAAVFHRKKS